MLLYLHIAWQRSTGPVKVQFVADARTRLLLIRYLGVISGRRISPTSLTNTARRLVDGFLKLLAIFLLLMYCIRLTFVFSGVLLPEIPLAQSRASGVVCLLFLWFRLLFGLKLRWIVSNCRFDLFLLSFLGSRGQRITTTRT